MAKRKKRVEPKKRYPALNLTKEQARMLEHPPTVGTWLCTEHDYPFLNARDQLKCSFCGAERPKKPRLLWPDYERAMKEINRVFDTGLEPGEARIRVIDTHTIAIRTSESRWRHLDNRQTDEENNA